MISKLMLIEQVTIQEKKQQLLNKGISNDKIDKLLQCDPTNKNKSDTDKVGSYTDWITSRYLKDRTFNNFDKLYKQLEQYDKSKHKIPDKELQNIGQFKTLDDLIMYINNNQDKLVIKTDKFVIEEKNDYDMFYSKNYIIHVPHTEEQSKKLGSGTKWCTSQGKENYFQSYYNEGYLFYITDKTTTQKRYNLYLQNKGAKIEFADDKNRHLTYKLFDIVKEDNTLIPQIKYYYEYKNIGIQSKINKLFQCKSVFDIVTFWEHNINTLAPAYFETNENHLINIASKYHLCGIQFISNPSWEVQIQQLNTDKLNINFIESITKKAQIQYVSMDTQQYNIMYLINQGIKPEHDVQLQQVSKNGQQIQYIINAGIRPEYDVQLQQVKDNGEQIQHIINVGIIPEHDVQLQQVSQYGYQIEYIIKAGIRPEHDVQLQQVSQNSEQLFYITKAGIRPEHDIQLQQVSQNGLQIRHIKNPSEEIQLQQINQNPDQYDYITNLTPKQTQLYKQLSGITESTGYISKLLDVN